MNIFLKYYFLIITSALYFSSIQAQNLEDYNWKNRVLIIFTDSVENDKYKAQQFSLKNSSHEFEEYKLKVISVLPTKFKIGLSSTNWLASKELQHKYNKRNKKFKVVLIGLDGGEKFSKTQVVLFPEIRALIDGMPMRRSELDRK